MVPEAQHGQPSFDARSQTLRGIAVATGHYEGMFILNSGKFGADPDAAGAEVAAIIEKIGGEVVAHRPWQDTKLAYPINGHRKGLYYLVFFTAESTRLNEINRIVQLNDNVIRHMIIAHQHDLFARMVEMISGGDAFRLVETEEPEDDAPVRSRRRQDDDDDDSVDDE
jgi:small subunit ribosomal protein S6